MTGTEPAGPAPDEPGPTPTVAGTSVTRRSLLGFGGVGLATLAAGFAGGFGTGRAVAAGGDAGAGAAAGSDVVPFFGAHQAGITTTAQDRLHFAAFDLTTTSRDALVTLLQRWTVAAERMTRALPAGELGPVGGPYEAPPDDTGEAQELTAAHLTITFGFGPSLFDDRFGLAARRPSRLADLPHFPGDTLDEARCGGDLAVQACADDPQVAVHAIRNLARIAFGTAQVRWSQLGYGRTARTSSAQSTPRNLFGFKDGTANILAEDTAALDRHVWVSPDDDAAGAWLAGGSYLVARRIRMTIETWDRGSLREQETVIGRTKGTGAPLSGGEETTDPDFTRTGREGAPLIDPASHVAMAHPDANGGARMLRRGYNYTDGSDGLGRLDAGLFFLVFVRDPAAQYVPVQNALAKNDLLSEYLRHTGSGLWAIPPGARAGGWVGEPLFAT